MFVLPNCDLLDVLTSEDGLKHIGTNNHMCKYENPKYSLQYIIIIALLNKINSYIQCIYSIRQFK
jgi:hypothetical protein